MKEGTSVNDLKFSVNKHPAPEILYKIAAHQGINKERSLRGLTNTINRSKECSDYFGVIVENERDDVVGYAGFIQNKNNPQKWLYTDLWVKEDCRRQGIAVRLVKAGLKHLFDIGAKTLYCTVNPDNHPSLLLQKTLGFMNIETEPFNELFVEGLMMFQLEV